MPAWSSAITVRRRAGATAVAVLGAALFGLWWSCSAAQSGQYDDAIVPLLMSLLRWTPFYWSEYRYGMLVPLLTAACRDPFTVFVVQNAVTAGLGLAAIVMLSVYFDRRHGVTAGLVAATLFVALCPPALRFDYLAPSQPYGTALALALAALFVVRGAVRRRSWWWLLPALLLVAAAHWVNPTVSLVLAPTLLIRAGLSPPPEACLSASPAWRRWPRALAKRLGAEGTLGLAMLAVVTLAAWSWLKLHGDRAPLGFGDLRAWGPGLVEMARSLTAATNGAIWAGSWLLAFGGLAAWARARRFGVSRDPPGLEQGPWEWPSAAALGICGVGYVLLVAHLRWVQMNHHALRYALPGLIAIQAGAASVMVRAGSRRLFAAGRLLPGSVVAALVLVLAASIGLPEPTLLRARLQARLGRATPELRQLGCTHLMGAYGNVWPAVFAGRLDRYERQDQTPLWGITFRAAATEALWRALPERDWRLCVFQDDPDVPRTARGFALQGFVPVAAGAVLALWQKAEQALYAEPPRE
ncbi:MAG: hypothetical protein HY903_24750 [Deltaproteobacteria bacterium]|nr:hypothetical protein [Deltaproteobacteria bacterium]